MRVTGSEDGPDALAVVGDATGDRAIGVRGFSASGEGVRGISETGEGVHAHTNTPHTVAALAVFHVNPASDGAAIFARKEGDKGLAAFLDGHVRVQRDLTVVGDLFLPTGADVAEHFDLADAADAEPGTVMVINDQAQLQPSTRAYDRRVAGVVSGAGPHRPALVLDGRDAVGCDEGGRRPPIALVGKVFCMADADYDAISVGDLLTSSPTPGHAMRASDRAATFGAVLGKSLGALPSGKGLIPILVTLQ